MVVSDVGIIETVFLLGYSPNARLPLTSTCTWAMLRADLLVAQSTHDHVVIISKFARSVNSLLYIKILA